jgi:beta-lactamase regulating signal transducer with metallopeptidase domain
MLVRLPLRRAPKIFTYVLWAAVLFRLVCPFTFTSAISALRWTHTSYVDRVEYLSQDVVPVPAPIIDTGADSIDTSVTASLPPATPTASVYPMQVWRAVASLVWLAGAAFLLVHGVISYARTRAKLATATRVDGNVFETDAVSTAFVCGFVRPRIYVPANVSDADLPYILEHERTHIRRWDYLVKPLAYLALVAHWFNPLMWVAFNLMSRDMEMACDESVLAKTGIAAKRGYSTSLLAVSMKQPRLIPVSPLAFGESHLKARVKNVLNYKKPALWIVLVAVVAVALVVTALVTNPLAAVNPDTEETPPIADFVEQNLAVIMSSPREASSSHAYVSAHKAEYDAILSRGDDSLAYMRQAFASGRGDDGLRGVLMEQLCQELLGANNPVKSIVVRTPTEWFAALESAQARAGDLKDFLTPVVGIKLEYQSPQGTYQQTAFVEDAKIVSELKSELLTAKRANPPPQWPWEKYSITFVAEGQTSEQRHEYLFKSFESGEPGYVAFEDGWYQVSGRFNTMLYSLTEYTKANGSADPADAELLGQYGYSPLFLISEQNYELPAKLIQNPGEYPTVVYWAYNNELSKDVGLDLTPYLGKTVSVNLYKLSEPLPEFMAPRQSSGRAIIVHYGGKIVGAWLDAGRHYGFACSLKNNQFEAVAGTKMEMWLTRLVDTSTAEAKRLAAFSPEDVIRNYYAAIDSGNLKEMHKYESLTNLVGYLFSNMDNNGLYNPAYAVNEGYGASNVAETRVDSIKAYDLPAGSTSPTVKRYQVQVYMKVKQPVVFDTGVQTFFMTVRQESPQIGWRIDGIGTGP